MQICYCVIIGDKRYPFGDSREFAISFANIKRKEGCKAKVVKEVYDNNGTRISNDKED